VREIEIGDDQSMKLTEQVNYSATPDAVFAMLCDKSFREEVCRQSGALSFEVSVTAEDESARIELKRVMPANVPDFVKKFVGDTIKLTQVEAWGPPNAAGRRTAVVTLKIEGQPAAMNATGTLEATSDGCIESVDGDVKVSIPLIGRKIEPEIAKAIIAALRVEKRVGTEWLAKA
jgi:hypothetical protein